MVIELNGFAVNEEEPARNIIAGPYLEIDKYLYAEYKASQIMLPMFCQVIPKVARPLRP